VNEALESIRLVRTINSRLLKSVTDSAWQNFCIHSVRGKTTLEDWLVTYVEHIPYHIEQLERTYDHWVSSRLRTA
jgi:hypothetical protein